METHSVTNRSSDLFKAVKRITKKFTASVDAVKHKDGNALYENEDIKRRWKEYCCNLYKAEDDNNQEEGNDYQGQGNDYHEQGDSQQEDQLNMNRRYVMNEKEPEPMLDEVIHALKESRDAKSPGLHGIPIELWKTDKGSEVLRRICVSIWNKREWPEDWVRSLFVPLPIKGDTMECGNNRTISLIVHASKVILRIISNRLKNKLEQEVSIQQAGFQKYRGTRDQLFNLRARLYGSGLAR